MIGENELRHCFQHRHLDLLPFAGARTMMQCADDGEREIETDHTVADVDGRVAGAPSTGRQAGNAGTGLHQIVVDRFAGVRAAEP